MYTALVMVATLAAQPAEPKPALPAFATEAIKPAATDTPLRKLQKERARERALAAEKMAAHIAVGRWEATTIDDYAKVRQTLAENLAELADKPEDRAKCFEMRVEAMKEMERHVAALVENGREAPQKLHLARAARMDSEIDLLKMGTPAAAGVVGAGGVGATGGGFATGNPPMPPRPLLPPPNADDAEALLRLSIQDIAALAYSLDKKEPIEKVRAAAMKLKTTTDKINALGLSKEDKAKLEEKYKLDLKEATALMLSAAMNNPDGFKLVQEMLKMQP